MKLVLILPCLIDSESHFSVVEPISVIWNQKREMLTNGPTFPFGFRKNLAGLFCSVSLNKTHLMLIIGYKEYGQLGC